MEKNKKLPTQPERSFDIRDPKLPVIHGTMPHNRGEDHRNPHPTEQVDLSL